MLCPYCGTMNDVNATCCARCGVRWPGRPDPAPASNESVPPGCWQCTECQRVNSKAQRCCEGCGSDADESWARLVRYFVGHVSETLGRATVFEALVQRRPPIVPLWRTLTALLADILQENTESETVEDQDAYENQWEKLLAFGRRTLETTVDARTRWIDEAAGPLTNICHPDSDAPAVHLECYLQRRFHRRFRPALWPGGDQHRWDVTIRTRLQLWLPPS